MKNSINNPNLQSVPTPRWDTKAQPMNANAKLVILLKLIVVGLAAIAAPIAMLILGTPCLFGWLSVFGGIPPGRKRFVFLAAIYLLAGCIMTFGCVIDALPFRCWEGWIVTLSMLLLIGVPNGFADKPEMIHDQQFIHR